MNGLTEVELYWDEDKIQRWIRFGHIVSDRILNRRARVVGFASGSIFAYVRWAANGYGTTVSRIDILRAASPGMAISTVPYVTPGAEILLRLSGWSRVLTALKTIDAVEAVGVDPADACPDHWRHVHNRITAGEAPRPYTLERHQAWALRRMAQP